MGSIPLDMKTGNRTPRRIFVEGENYPLGV